MRTSGPATEIERASNADLAFLAMDDGRPPQQFAVILVMDATVQLSAVERLLRERVAGVPRLRQRLLHTPPGCGRAVWIDDEAFDVRPHLTSVSCNAPGDDGALLDVAVPLVLEPLPRDRPLWRVVLIDGLAGGGTALVVITHHVLADGLGGLAVLDQLLDDRHAMPTPAAAAAVRSRPSSLRLAADAMRARFRALRAAGTKWRQLRSSMAAGGGMAPARAEPCSLIRRTGARRVAAVVHADLLGLRDTAHRYGGTVNAALLVAVAAALRRVLEQRRETIDAVVVAVPVAGRRPHGTGPGNAVSPLLVNVPTTGAIAQRIRQVADTVRRGRDLATGPAPIAVLGAAFRLIAALGGYQWYMQHQRRLHTVVSYVRGPESVVRFAGTDVRAMIPLVVGGATNVTVAFQAISYAGTISVTAMADPDRCPDLPSLVRALQRQLTQLTLSSRADSPPDDPGPDAGPTVRADRPVPPQPTRSRMDAEPRERSER